MIQCRRCILHIRYTARESDALKSGSEDALVADGPVGYRLFSAKADFPSEWAVFSNVEEGATSQTLGLPFTKKHFQKLRDEATLKITSVHIFAKRLDATLDTIEDVVLTPPYVSPATPDPETLDLTNVAGFGALISAVFDDGSSYAVTILDETSDGFASWTLAVPADEVPLDDIWIICTYQKAT